jgi:heterodisulfide reductase subunit A-like polyferredoxin
MTEEDRIQLLDHGIPKAAKELAVRYARVPGVHIIVRTDRCRGCGACVRKGFCRFGAISISERTVSIDERRCRGCARCTHLCPSEALAIEVRPHPLVNRALRHIDHRIERLLK